ncbi:MAG: hypothetical protein ACTSRW_06720 [Candidatus Helarchaeota archaeon]
MPNKIFQNEEYHVQIDYLPENFILQELSGNKEEGKIIFESREILDESYGAYIKFEYSWNTIEFDFRLSDGDLIDEIDRQYQRLRINSIERNGEYINTHYNQYITGSRIIVQKEIQYPTVEINGVFYCEHSERQFNYRFMIYRKIYEEWKNTLLEIIHAFKCHF